MNKELLDFMTWVNKDKKLGYTSIGIERIINTYTNPKEKQKMMNKEEQKLVGYIIYDIWTCGVSHDRGVTWQKQTIIPEVHWKHKIYLTEASANDAAKHIIGKDNLHKAVIIPIYANKNELNKVKDEWNHLKQIINEQPR